MKRFISRIASVAMVLSMLVLLHATALAQSTLIVDRGLPTINLNDAAGGSRSNVSWAEPDLQYLDGDDFTVPSGSWRIDTIRLWFVGYNANNDANLNNDTFLGDFYKNISLYVGAVDGSLTRVSLANFVIGSDDTDSPNVVATRVQYNGGVGSESELDYQSGNYWTIVQFDFKNLNLYFAGGTQVQFGMHTDQGIVDGDYVFSHASNAALSGSTQAQADGLFRVFQLDADPATATFVGIWDSNGGGWDKSSDINVQVFATRTRVATSKDQCKNDGWKKLIRANGTSFKNQGDCIQYVNTGK